MECNGSPRCVKGIAWQHRLTAGALMLISLAACDSDPADSPDVLLQRARAERDAGHLQVAIATVRQLLQQVPDSVPARSLRADLFTQVRDFPAASMDYLRLVTLGVDTPELKQRLAEALVGSGEHQPALELLETLTDKQASATPIQVLRARALEGLERLPDAETAFTQAFDQSPDDGDARFHLAAFRYRRGLHRESATLLEDIPSAIANRPDVLRLRADLAQILGNYTQAKSLYESLSQRDDWGGWPPPPVGIARANIYLGEFEAANRDLDHYLAQRPDDVWATYYRAIGAFLAREYDLAERLAESVMLVAPQYSRIFLLIGAARYGRGAYTEAQAPLGQFLLHNENHRDAQALLAAARLKAHPTAVGTHETTAAAFILSQAETAMGRLFPD